MLVGLVLNALGIGFFCWLIFELAVYALPFFVLCSRPHNTDWTKPLRGRERMAAAWRGKRHRVRGSGINDPSLRVAPSDPWPR